MTCHHTYDQCTTPHGHIAIRALGSRFALTTGHNILQSYMNTIFWPNQPVSDKRHQLEKLNLLKNHRTTIKIVVDDWTWLALCLHWLTTEIPVLSVVVSWGLRHASVFNRQASNKSPGDHGRQGICFFLVWSWRNYLLCINKILHLLISFVP